MSSILNIAVSGLTNAAARVANASQNIVNAASTNFTPQDIISLSNASSGVTTATEPRNPASVPIFDPTATNANANGFTTVPNVDQAAELVSVIAAKSDYAASAAVVKTVEKMNQALLDITT